MVIGHAHEDGCCGSESPFPDASDEPENPWPDEDEECPWPDDPPPASSPSGPADVYPPCVSAGPSVSPSALLNAAKQAGAVIESSNDEAWEFGSYLYLHNGQIFHNQPQTQFNSESVAISMRGVPDGATVLGYIHNHPERGWPIDQVPSSDDWSNYSGLMATTAFPRGISLDPDALLFIYTDNNTRVYDKNDHGTTVASCAI